MKQSILTAVVGITTLLGVAGGMQAGEVIANWQFKDAANPGKDSTGIAGHTLKVIGGNPEVKAGEITLHGGTIKMPKEKREYLDCTSKDFDLNGSSFTVECWFKSPNISYMKLVGTRSTIRPIYKTQVGWVLGLSKGNGSIMFILNDKAKKVSVAKIKIMKSTWDLDELNYLVGVRDLKAKTLKLYVNGELVSTVDDKSGDISRDGRLNVGYDLYAGSFVKGTFFEIKISKDVMSAEAIAKQFKAGPAK
jgi:Concanavalin A-like lectin/glucanases superfamily